MIGYGFTRENHLPLKQEGSYLEHLSIKMSKKELIDEHVSVSQCKKAVNALLGHATKVAERNEETELLPGREENIWLVLSVKKSTSEKKLKPSKIPLAHPIIDPRTSPICLITKDPQREYKDLLSAQNIKFINRVVGVKKLKGKFKPFEARRMLLKENGLFLADERVVPLLPNLLGKIFFKAKKQPIPVSLTKKDLKTELEQAVSSTYMHLNQGTCSSIKIGTISQSAQQILDNLKTALPAIVKRIEGGWTNIQSFHIKTNSSVSLPVWTCSLDATEGGRWGEVTSGDVVKSVEGEVDNSEESEDEPTKKETSTDRKGKKRSADSQGEPPNKKTKKAIQTEETPDEGTTKSAKKKKTKDVETPAKATSPGKELSEKSTKNKKKAVEKDTKKPSKGKAPEISTKEAEGDKPSKATKKSTAKPSQEVERPKSILKTTSTPQNGGPAKEQMKKKKLDTGLEKKKEKLTKVKTGSVKEGILGKKAKSRI